MACFMHQKTMIHILEINMEITWNCHQKIRESLIKSMHIGRNNG